MLLLNKSATIYSYSRDANHITSYVAGATFDCNLQPVGVKDGFTGEMVFKMKKLYTDYNGIVVGDKLTIDSKNYVVKEFENREGTYQKFYKAFIQKSEGN